MEKFTAIDTPAVPLALPNINTDQIIPARFLRKPRAAGLGQFLFHDLRFNEAGRPRPEFPLDEPVYRGAQVLIAEHNFGCGSSREYAVLALRDFGFRALLAPSFGDIFFENCFQNGVLPIRLPEAAIAASLALCMASPGTHAAIDLAAQRFRMAQGIDCRFDVEPFRKHCLLEGLDELGFTLGQEERIVAVEKRLAAETPWL